MVSSVHGKIKKRTLTERLRRSFKYKRWQQAVFRQGDFTCIQCGSREKITADHIKPIVAFPGLAYEVSNGQVLCDKCRVKGMLKQHQNGELRKTGGIVKQ